MGIAMETKDGYKKTKLGWIPEDWEIEKISNITKVKAGGTPSTKNEKYWNGDIKWMSSGELNHRKIHDVKSRITKLGLESSSTHLLPNKCVLIGLAGQGKTRGTVAINFVELCTNQSIAAMLPSRNYVCEFLFFNLLNRYNEIRRMSTGDGGRGGLNLKIIGSIKIPLPPLPEQKKIADILSTWDKAIETTQALIEKLQLRKKGLMQQLLTGKKRLPEFSREWEEIKFSDIISERTEYPEDDLPLYSLTIQDGVTPKTERYERSFLLTSKVNAYKKMCKGDFALNPMNLRFGAIAMHKGDIDVCVSKYYNIFYCLESCNPIFFEYYLKSYPMIHYYNKMAIGSLEEKKRVHYKDFLKFKKNLPSKEEQTAIAQVFSQADESILQTQKYLEQLQEQKKGLMQQLLTGQRRVKI